MIQKGNATLLQRFPKDYFAEDVNGSKCLNATLSDALFCMHYVGKVIYHKFSHSDVSYRFNGKNVNVMLRIPYILFEQTMKALEELLLYTGFPEPHCLPV